MNLIRTVGVWVSGEFCAFVKYDVDLISNV